MNKSSYGYCPICGSKGIGRERRMNGDDWCDNGHKYPSKNAIVRETIIKTEKSNRYSLSKEQITRIYNTGYSSGHHDTVEACYVDILDVDKCVYHSDEVVELIKEIKND